MDYLLADRYVVPQGAEPYYREQVLRMPDGYLCYDPPREAPAVGPLPALAAGYATFGSFNNPAKITPQVVEVLGDDPPPRAAVAAGAEIPRAGRPDRAAGCLRTALPAAGVEPQRLELLPPSPFAEYLAAYRAGGPWRWIPSRSPAAPRPARRCGWGCR